MTPIPRIPAPAVGPRWTLAAALAPFLAVAWTQRAWAGDAAPALDWFDLAMHLFGGLALFLAGLELLSEGLKKAAGQALRDVLARLTSNRVMGAVTGAFVTAVLNSSSVTTVLVVGFVTAGMMSLSQSVGIIMGANIGSTFTAQILAFNVAQYALLPVAVGFFLWFTAKTERPRHYGMMLMGLGLVFYGMGVMSDGMKPLRSYEPFLQVLQQMERPLLGVLAGAVFTALVQSSAATVGIAIAMASEGLLSLPAGIALALGANIGTCVTALMASLGKPTEARRAAVVHLLFNVLGVLLWLGLIPLLAKAAVQISPTGEGLVGTARAAAEVPRQLANANTLFNVINTVVFLGFTPWFARLAERLVPERVAVPGVIIAPQHLDEAVLSVPSMALDRVRQEFGRAGEIAVGMLGDMREAFLSQDRTRIDEVARRDDQVDILQAAILGYLGRLRQGLLTEQESRDVQALMTAVVNLEGLADVVETDLAGLARRALDGGLAVREADRELRQGLFEAVSRALALAVKAVRDNDQQAAEAVLLLKDDVRGLSDQLFARRAEGLSTQDPGYVDTLRLELSALEQIRRVYTLSKRIARVVLPEPVAAKA